MDGAINPNVTIDNQAPTADQIMDGMLRPKVWSVYDKNGNLVARLDRADEAAAYNTSLPGQYVVKEEDNPQLAPPAPAPTVKKPTKKNAK